MILRKGYMNRLVIRAFDLISSSVGMVFLSPVFVFTAIALKTDSKGPVFYLQNRVGRNGLDFKLYKFRTMRTDADKFGFLTVGSDDPRITRVGAFLRKYKLDELPQLWNVLKGEMSLVGPRPEVRRYTDLYSPDQKKLIFSVRPGITDYASIEYSNENNLLSTVPDPEQYYVNELLPAKIRLNLVFIENPSFGNYLKIIFRTIAKIFAH